MIVPPDAEGQRVADYLRSVLPDLPESVLRRVFASRDVKLDSIRVSRDLKLKEGQVLKIYIPDAAAGTSSAVPSLSVIYEDDDVLLVNKRAGISVEPDARGGITLTDLCREYVRQKDPDAFSPAACHRLDNRTCGLCLFAKNQISKGLMLLKAIRGVNASYKDVNALINRYQELSQNSNLQIYLSSGSSDFVTLCRKFIAAKYKNAHVKIQDINVGPLFTDILAEISTLKWDNVDIFRFFRTSGSTGEIYVREFHGHMQDIKADRGYCISAGTFSEECRKFTEGRPIDLIEKNELVKVLKVISI